MLLTSANKCNFGALCCYGNSPCTILFIKKQCGEMLWWCTFAFSLWKIHYEDLAVLKQIIHFVFHHPSCYIARPGRVRHEAVKLLNQASIWLHSTCYIHMPNIAIQSVWDITVVSTYVKVKCQGLVLHLIVSTHYIALLTLSKTDI